MKFEPPGIYIQLATEGGPGIIGTLLWVSGTFTFWLVKFNSLLHHLDLCCWWWRVNPRQTRVLHFQMSVAPQASVQPHPMLNAHTLWFLLLPKTTLGRQASSLLLTLVPKLHPRMFQMEHRLTPAIHVIKYHQFVFLPDSCFFLLQNSTLHR